MGYLAVSAAVFAVIALAPPSALAADCGADADEVNAKCYPNLQAAVDAALSTDRPLVLPGGTYHITAPLVIDYSRHADTGFELISRGATIDGTAVRGPALIVECAADCFYFHQEGTLFVNANMPGQPAVMIGKPDFSDPQNSIKIDHLIVNNGNSAGIGCQFNYVLNADIFAVCDTAGVKGIAFEQTQFSNIRGSASAANGAAMAIENGYSFANTLTSFDLEASPVCYLITTTKATAWGDVAPYSNCPTAVATTHAAWSGWTAASQGVAGMLGGDVRAIINWLD
jgi:hypothetical protein